MSEIIIHDPQINAHSHRDFTLQRLIGQGEVKKPATYLQEGIVTAAEFPRALDLSAGDEAMGSVLKHYGWSNITYIDDKRPKEMTDPAKWYFWDLEALGEYLARGVVPKEVEEIGLGFSFDIAFLMQPESSVSRYASFLGQYFTRPGGLFYTTDFHELYQDPNRWSTYHNTLFFQKP